MVEGLAVPSNDTSEAAQYCLHPFFDVRRSREKAASTSNTRNRCPPTQAPQPTPAVQPPRDDAEGIEPVLVGRGPCKTHSPANLLPAHPARTQPDDLRIDGLELRHPA